MKMCGRCKEVKSYDYFNKYYKTKDGYDKRCKECKYIVNLNARLKKFDRYAELNRQRSAKWRKENSGVANFHASKYRAAKLERTANWADLNYIRDLYVNVKEANEMFKDYNIVFHIDHDIPLQGKLVSGLHVENNLQVLSAYDNLSKSNNYEVL